MSDCPDCDNVGWTLEFAENANDELSGEFYRLPCRNWRHRCRPTLEEIGAAVREEREPPHPYRMPETHGVTESEIPF